jgi:hypothetical protein
MKKQHAEAAVAMDPRSKRPATPILLGAFFAFAAIMACLASLSLLLPDIPLGLIWSFKRAEYAQLLALGPWVGWAFLLLAIAATLASYGSFRRRQWGWVLSLAIFAVNGLGDAIRLMTGAWVEGLIGVCVTAAIVVWLTRPSVRALFKYQHSARRPKAES